MISMTGTGDSKEATASDDADRVGASPEVSDTGQLRGAEFGRLVRKPVTIVLLVAAMFFTSMLFTVRDCFTALPRPIEPV